jgi:glucose/arabinose dehydrogenase
MMQSWFRIAAVLMALLPVMVRAQGQPTTLQSASGAIHVERIAALEFPWGIARLPDGRLLITEKRGRLRIYANGKLSEPVENVPATTYRERKSEQGGLLDVVADPGFTQNRRIYFSYSEAAPEQPAGAADTGDARFGGNLDLTDNVLSGGAVASAVLDGARLTDVRVIWRQVPKTVGRGHFGNRLVFGRDGTLFVTSGERMRFDPAQDLASNLGKVVRINTDGSNPKDNPFSGKAGARGDIWSVGHRNMLAAAVHPETGRLWVFEMGPLGGDELNIIQPGRNYGWPIVSNGDNYDKSPIPDHPRRPEFEAPVRTWTPVISPSGALFYQGSLFPWRGNVLVGGLSARGLVRLTVDDERVTDEERIDMRRRVRDVIEDADGSLLVITDDKNGELLRLTPASGSGARRPIGTTGR